MKRCVILFALLLLTLFLAIWTDDRRADLSMEESVALESHASNTPESIPALARKTAKP